VAIDAAGVVWRYEGNGTGLQRRFRMATGFGSKAPAF
jgi:hypothetical protein